MFMFLGMVAVISYHPKFRRYHLFGRWWRSDWPRFRALWKLGLPIGVTMGLEGGVFGFAVILIGLIDTASVAAHAIALQVASVTFMVPLGLAQAATVRVGIGYGRRDHALIRRYDYSLKPGWQLDQYGLEQQAEIVRHIFLLRNGGKVAGAPPLSQYEGVLPF